MSDTKTDLTQSSLLYEIGNIELTNYLIQKVIQEVESKVERLKGQLGVLNAELDKGCRAFVEVLHRDASKQWDSKIRELVSLLLEFGYIESRNFGLDEYEISYMDLFKMKRAVIEDSRNGVPTDLPTQFVMTFQIYHTTKDSKLVNYLYLPSPRAGSHLDHTVTVQLSEAQQAKYLELCEIEHSSSLLRAEISKLKSSIEDRQDLKDRALASLTERAMMSNEVLKGQVAEALSSLRTPLVIESAE